MNIPLDMFFRDYPNNLKIKWHLSPQKGPFVIYPTGFYFIGILLTLKSWTFPRVSSKIFHLFIFTL